MLHLRPVAPSTAVDVYFEVLISLPKNKLEEGTEFPLESKPIKKPEL
jgi:hypothetical protein